MNQNDSGCPEQRDSLTLLAYLEGELEPEARVETEAHLRVCSWCRTEFENLRRVDAMLRMHPEAFHPAAEDLHRFAATGLDRDGVVAGHMAVCESCREDVSLLKELKKAGADVPSAPRMPATLKSQVRVIADKPLPASWWRRAWERFSTAWSGSHHLPMLAAGTAVAVLVVAVLVAPLFKAGKATLPSSVDHLKELQKESERPPTSETIRREPRMAYPKSNYVRKPPMAVLHGRADEARLPEGAPPSAPAPALSDKDLRAKRKEGAPGELKQGTAGRPQPASALPTASAPRDARVGTPQLPVPGAAPQAMAPRERALPRVRIVDEHARDIPWLHVDPGLVAGLHEYRPSERDEGKGERESLDVREPAAKRELRVGRVAPEKGLSLLIRVLPDGPMFTVEASLATDDDATPRKTRTEAQVPKDKLQETIDKLVRTLLREP